MVLFSRCKSLMGSRLGVANPQAKKLIKVAGYDSSINISLPLVNTKANVRYSKFMAFSIIHVIVMKGVSVSHCSPARH